MKKLFVLMALVIFLAVSAVRAEVFHYLGTSANVQVELSAWGQKIDGKSWEQLCLSKNKQIDESHFDFSLMWKCTGKDSVWFRNVLDANDNVIGDLLDIPVTVPNNEKKGCEKGKEEDCPQFEHYRFLIGSGASTQTAAPDAPQAKSPDSAEQSAPAEPAVQSTTSPVDFLLPLKGFVKDAVVDMFYAGEVANPAQTVRTIEGEAKAMGTVDVCIFPGYPLKTQDVDERGRSIFQIKFATRFCAQPLDLNSHAAIFGFTFGADGEWYRVYISYRSSHGNHHLFVADNPRREKSQSTSSF